MVSFIGAIQAVHALPIILLLHCNAIATSPIVGHIFLRRDYVILTTSYLVISRQPAELQDPARADDDVVSHARRARLSPHAGVQVQHKPAGTDGASVDEG